MTQSKVDLEQKRLKALQAADILDTPPEERFDRLTRLAKRVFGVPMAMVTLVDADRLWYKSCAGGDVQHSPREDSFCGHAILGDDLLIIPDTHLDKRFDNNPQAHSEESAIRFYAGCPIQTIEGNKLGTLCLIDYSPREFSQEDQESLRDLTQIVERELVAVQLATQDELTGIINRRGLMAHTKQLLNLCERNMFPVTLVFFDLTKTVYIDL